MTVTAAQLALDVPNVAADPLADLELHGHERRLDVLDGVEFMPPALAPTCSCTPHGLYATDEDGITVVCWACGREVTGDGTPVLPAQSGDGLRSGHAPAGHARGGAVGP